MSSQKKGKSYLNRLERSKKRGTFKGIKLNVHTIETIYSAKTKKKAQILENSKKKQ